jgi:hypothetical protein
MPIIPALAECRQEDCEFEASLGYIIRSCLRILKRKKKKAKLVHFILSIFYHKNGIPLHL